MIIRQNIQRLVVSYRHCLILRHERLNQSISATKIIARAALFRAYKEHSKLAKQACLPLQATTDQISLTDFMRGKRTSRAVVCRWVERISRNHRRLNLLAEGRRGKWTRSSCGQRSNAMRLFRLYSGDDQQSHIEELKMQFTPGQL